MDNKYNLLLTKDIFAILDGDAEFGPYQFSDGSSVQLQMPYLSGPTLCEIATKFGLAMKYLREGGSLSRWMYLKELMEYCITNKKNIILPIVFICKTTVFQTAFWTSTNRD